MCRISPVPVQLLMNDDELAFLCERFDEERADRLEQKLGGSHEWDNEEPSA